jgi:hypothetical protein
LTIRFGLRVLALLLLPAIGAAAQPIEPPSEESEFNQLDVNIGFSDIDDAQVLPLVEKLGSWEIGERDSAQKRLIELGPGAFRALARVYRDRDDFEVRLRIEELVRQQYLWHSLLKRKGFLGIGYAHVPDPKGTGGWILDVTIVQPNSAAAKAGLLVHDLIVGVDDKPLKEDLGADAFRKYIVQKGADGKVKLEVLRGGQTLSFDVTLQARPLDQYFDRNNPGDPRNAELTEELNNHLQMFAAWWSRHFSLPQHRPDRSPSSSVFELPE